MTFFEYMMKYLNKDTPAGDLARDLNRDKENFPQSNDGKEIMDYLFSKGACSQCLDTFEKCYAQYVKYELRQYKRLKHEQVH